MFTRKSCFGIVLLVALACITVTRAGIVFQEDFSGYSAAGTLGSTAQVGTWSGTDMAVGSHTLRNGSTGYCMEFIDTSTTVLPTVSADFISYFALPIKISYDFQMQRSVNDNSVFAAHAVANATWLTYCKIAKQDATEDYFELRGNGGSTSDKTYYAKNTWYTMELELPSIPASGTFTMTYTIYDASGTELYTKDIASWAGSTGVDIDELLFRAGWGTGYTSNMLIDNILVETIEGPPPIPGTIGYWRFENGAILGEDSSGNGYTLTAVNSPVQYLLPISGKGATFDDPIPRNGLANDYSLNLIDTNAYFTHPDEFAFAVSNFTVEAYVDRDAGPFNNLLAIASQYYTTIGQRSWLFGINGSYPYELVLYVSEDGTSGTLINSGIATSGNKDYFVSVSFDQGDQASGVKFYLKDLATGDWTTSVHGHSIVSLHNSTATLIVGSGNGSSYTCDAVIDEVRFSNIILTQDKFLTTSLGGTLIVIQ